MMSRAEVQAFAEQMFASVGDLVPACTLQRETPGDYNPETGQPGNPTVATDTGYIFFTNGILAKRVAQGREVEANWQGAYAAGFKTLKPDEGDTLVVEGRDWRVADSDDLLLAGALWELVVVPK